jgi:hypothetical protein
MQRIRASGAAKVVASTTTDNSHRPNRGRPLTPAAQQFYQTILDTKRSGMADAAGKKAPK